MKKGCYIIMSKSIRISDENYKKLTAIGKGKIDDKFSTLLDQHQQTLIDQSKPSAAKTEEPPTDYFLGLIIRYYHRHQLEIDRDIDPAYLEVHEKTRSRSSLRNTIEQITKENGWHNEYPTFFTDMRNTKGRFQNKIDKCLELLVRNEVLERVEGGYKFIEGLLESNVEVAKLTALRYLTVTTTPPVIYYKQNQKRKTFEDGSPVPSIDIHLGRFNAPGIMHQDQ